MFFGPFRDLAGHQRIDFIVFFVGLVGDPGIEPGSKALCQFLANMW
jgi:hypothetical protein